MNAPVPTGELARDDAASDPGLDPDFEALYRDNYAFVWRCARRMCVGEDELEDVIQDVFVIAYRRRERLDPGIKPGTWLFGILRNVVRNRARGRGRHQRRVQAYATQIDARERRRRRMETELGERVLAGELLAGFLRELDEGQRAVFVLAELEGYTGKEIAAALSINPNTAHSRLRLARRAFRAHFGLEGGQAVSSATRELREQAEQPSQAARAHSWGLVAAALARPSWLTAPAGALVSVLGSKVAVALAGIAVAAGIGGAALGGAALVDRGRDEVPEQVRALVDHERSASSSSSGSAMASPVERGVVMLADSEEAPVVVKAPERRPSARGKAPAVDIDVGEQLRKARAALIEGRPAHALALLDAIPGADTRLLEPRAATRVAALCKLGQVEVARAIVTQLHEQHGDSPVLARIDGACW